MSDQPAESPMATTSAGPDPYAPAHTAMASHGDTAGGSQWTPLLSRTMFIVALVAGVVVGIAGPILLWLNLSYVNKGTPFYERVGYLLVLVGLGLLIVALPLLLGEAARLERTSAIGVAAARPDQGHRLTGTRVFAAVGVVILLAGVFLLRPVEPSDTGGGGGSSQGGGGGRG